MASEYEVDLPVNPRERPFVRPRLSGLLALALSGQRQREWLEWLVVAD